LREPTSHTHCRRPKLYTNDRKSIGGAGASGWNLYANNSNAARAACCATWNLKAIQRKAKKAT
jgi:hypothetical protein